MIDTAKLVSAIGACGPVEGAADLGPISGDALERIAQTWPHAILHTFADGRVVRVDVSDAATPAQRSAIGSALAVMDAPQITAPRRLVAKALIVDRLHAAGKLEAAYAALQASDVHTRLRWDTRSEIYADDETAAQLLTAIGADPAAIMAEPG